MKLLTVEDWYRMVVNRETSPGITDATRTFLLHLASKHMREGRNGVPRIVSVPRAQLSAELGVRERGITQRFKDAVDAGLLARVVAGHNGVTAVYQGVFPDRMTISSGPPVPPSTSMTKGATNRPPTFGSSGPPGEPTTSKCNTSRPPGHQSSGSSSTRSASAERALKEEEQAAAGASALALEQRGPSFLSKTELAGSTLASGVKPALDAGVGRATPQRDPSRQHDVHNAVGDVVDRATRTRLLDLIQRDARDNWGYLSEELVDLLEECMDGIGHLAANKWSFPYAAATDRYLAGKQLNMLFHTYREEAA